MKSACAWTWSSVIVVPKASQLFQPMGGVGAQARKRSAAGHGRTTATAEPADGDAGVVGHAVAAIQSKRSSAP